MNGGKWRKVETKKTLLFCIAGGSLAKHKPVVKAKTPGTFDEVFQSRDDGSAQFESQGRVLKTREIILARSHFDSA